MELSNRRTSPFVAAMRKMHYDVLEKRKKCDTEGTYENILTHTFFTALVVRNEFAINSLLKSFDMIRKNKKMYQHEIKRYLKETEKAKGEYCVKTSIFAYNDSLLGYLDEISGAFGKRIQNSYNTMYLTIKREMIDHGVQNAELFAQIEICSLYLETTIEVQRSECRTESGMGEIFKEFKYMELQDLNKKWKKTCEYIYKRFFPYEVNLNTKKCTTAYNGMVNAMRDYKYILSLITEKKHGESDTVEN